jgi:heptosyltransferase-2
VSESVIVRLPNWLGDTVMAVPAIRALRQALDGGRLLLAGPWVTVLRDQALADVLVTYPRSWSGRLATADTVRDFGGATTVLLPNSFEAAAAALYWGARRRIGFAVGGRRWLLTDPVELPEPRRHQADEYARLVERLGVAVDLRTPRLDPPAAASPERRRVRALMREAGVEEPAGAAALVGVHLGAAHGSAKIWDPGRVVELCRLLRARGTTALLLGAPSDVPFVEEVGRAARVPSLAGRDGPELLPALLAELNALVSGDTGVAHLAAALGTPVVVLFGPTDPRLTAPRGPVAVVRGDAPCAPCFYRTCPIDHPCMRAIEAPAVVERLDALLAVRA